MSDGGILQFDPSVVRPHQTRWDVARRRGEDVKLELSPGWNLVRAERSKISIYAYVEKKAGPKVSNRENKHKIGDGGITYTVGKLNNERATLLFDSGAEVSIVDSTFARKVGCYVDNSQRQECVGIGENAYMTEGRTKIKVTLAGTLVYYFDAWVGSLS
ncbi:Hypothetical protein PHPALM_2879, partial [Phytophthora palmivora]